MASPWLIKSKMKQVQSDDDFKALRTATEYDKAPDFDGYGVPTDAYKARFMANLVKERLTKKR
jgi:hypothetical protein